MAPKQRKPAVKPPSQPSYTAQSYRNYVLDWSPALIRSAEMQADAGSLRAAASLCEAMLGDDRVRGCLQEVKSKGLLGLPLSFEEGSGRSKKRAVKALDVEADWYSSLPEATLAELITWADLLGIGVLHADSWEANDSGRLVPCYSNVHPASLNHDETRDVWQVAQADGSWVDIDETSGEWIVFTPYGRKRPWARGSWHALSRYWLSKQYAISDWSRYSERHGQGLYVVSSDKDAISTEDDRRNLAADLQNLGREKAIALAPGFSLALVEATANTWSTFQAQIDAADKAIAICILGQNLSTDVAGGSLAAASVHAAVKAQVLQGLAECLSTCLHDQFLALWAQWNFGDARLAPWPSWDTSAPEDVSATVASWVQAGQALATFSQLGASIDLEEVARKIGLPLKEGVESVVAPPPVAEQPNEPPPVVDQPTDQPAQVAASRVMYATESKAQRHATEALEQHAIAAGATAMAPTVSAILEIIASASNAQDLKHRLIASFGSTTDLETIIERALILAELQGRADVLEAL